MGSLLTLPRYGMRESQTLHEVRSTLALHGCMVIRIHQSMGSEKGISDLIAVKNGVVLFIEVKNYPGKTMDGKEVRANDLSKHQVVWRDNLVQHGGNYYVLRCAKDAHDILSMHGLLDPRVK